MKSKQRHNNLFRIGLIFFFAFFPVVCKADTEKEIRSIISSIERKYSIRLFYKSIPKATWEGVKYTKVSQPDMEQLLGYLKLFDKELNKYPQQFVKATKLKSVAFVKELSLSGQLRAAVPDYYKGILFLDFARGDYSEIYQRHVIHHEFYHMVEKQFNGDAYWKDPNWIKLNDDDFKYGSGGAFEQGGSNMYEISHPRKGFVNLYSMSAPEEDKAEVYACLFVNGERQKLNEWIKDDDVLKKKVNYLKRFLFTRCEEMNSEYWTKL
jgi:hypothetical protein